MRQALASLPGVEKDSIQVSADDKTATFKVKEPATFKVDEATQAVTEAGFKATLARTGTGLSAK